MWLGIYDKNKGNNANRLWRASDDTDPGFFNWGAGQPSSPYNQVCVSHEPGETMIMQDRPCGDHATFSKKYPLCRFLGHSPAYDTIQDYLTHHYPYTSFSSSDEYFRTGMIMIFLA